MENVDEIKIGDKFQTMSSNGNKVYEVISINNAPDGKLIRFSMSGGGTHTLAIWRIKDYIQRGRMVKINN